MNTAHLLNNDLKLMGFDADKFINTSNICRIVMIEQDPTGMIKPFQQKEKLIEVFIKDGGGYEAFDHLSINDKNKEAIIYLNLEVVDPYFLKQLRRYAELNDMRFYILSRKPMSGKYIFLSDLYCRYKSNGDLLILRNKYGPTTNTYESSSVENRYYEVKDNDEKEYESLDFNIISPEEQYISINYRGGSTTINCASKEEVIKLSDEITRTIEKIEKNSNTSILIDVRSGKDENDRTIIYELRQNLNGSFVILKETYFGSSKIKLPIKDGVMSPVEAISEWVSIR